MANIFTSLMKKLKAIIHPNDTASKNDTRAKDVASDELQMALEKIRIEREYDIICQSNSDIRKISLRTGMPIELLKSIKSHIFIEEHILSDGKGSYMLDRFAPSVDTLNAWKRLMQGTFIKSDLEMLRYAYAEALIMQGTKVAHPAAQEVAKKYCNQQKETESQ